MELSPRPSTGALQRESEAEFVLLEGAGEPHLVRLLPSVIAESKSPMNSHQFLSSRPL